jgi:membrane protease YdiL (CAAX protease family)
LKLNTGIFKESLKKFIKKHPVVCYFILTFLLSWLGAFILVAPKLFSGQSIPKIDGILMFPLMLIGPVTASFILTALTEGETGVKNLLARISKWKAPLKCYVIAFIIPLCLILIALFILQTFVSPVFKPNFFPLGFLFGIPAGFFEEIGWTGYAYPKMRLKFSVIKTALIVGFLWGLWHLPVIDFLGAATPHEQYLLRFFIAFIAILAAMRVIMMWIYSKTNSMPLVQVMHVVSTGCLVTLGPFNISPAQESLWYASYAIILWITAFSILLLAKPGKH